MSKVRIVTTRILLQSPFLADMTLVEVPDSAGFDAVRQAVLAAIPANYRHPENEMTVEGGEDDRQASGEQKVKDGMRVHVGRCKQVTLTVRFMGQPNSHHFPPATRIKRIKEWAVREFNVAAAEASRHGLYLAGTDEELSGDVHIGSLVRDGGCSLTLDLLPTDRIQGA